MPGATLALNAGSSSIKFGLFEVREGSGLDLMSKGGIEGIGGDRHFTAPDAAGSMLEDKPWRGKDAEYDAMLGALCWPGLRATCNRIPSRRWGTEWCMAGGVSPPRSG